MTAKKPPAVGPDTKGGVAITRNGPYLVSGGLPLATEIIEVGREGIPASWRLGRRFPARDSYALCRCGQSGGKPFCDGSRIDHGFDDGDRSIGHRRDGA